MACLIAYLTGFFENYKKADLLYDEQNSQSLIEFLTQHKTKKKDYTNAPKEFTNHSKKLVGKKINDKVMFKYEFPLVGGDYSIYETTLYPITVSQQVDSYGLQDHLIIKLEDSYKLNTQVSEEDFKINMNKDGWYFNSYQDFGVDYKYITLKYSVFCKEIADNIFNDLSKKRLDSFYNRVQAALNFVQFIPYGLPEFDSKGWFYFGIGVPPESFILGYGDCDSKSVFFASILMHLIPIENIVLILCKVKASVYSSNGGHMMVGVSDIGINGESVKFKNKDYLLLETTAPVAIGDFHWQSFQLDKIIELT
jgi:hypothetical protein